ncbi:hypothetical protein ACN6MY_05015 [Peribacillus sp. B-H-3]
MMSKNSATEQGNQKLNHDKLKLKEKIAYGIGDVGNNFLLDMGQI